MKKLKIILILYAFPVLAEIIDKKDTQIIYKYKIHPHLPDYYFKFTPDNKNGVSSIKIYEGDPNKNSTIQEIDLSGIDFCNLLWNQVYNPSSFKVIDFNFDGYLDLRLLSSFGSGQSNYLVWLFDPKSKKFIYSQDLSHLPSINIDHSLKWITSSAGGIGGLQSYDIYLWKSGKIKLFKRLNQKPIKNVEGLSRKVFQYDNQSEKLICDFEIIYSKIKSQKDNENFKKANKEDCLFDSVPLPI